MSRSAPARNFNVRHAQNRQSRRHEFGLDIESVVNGNDPAVRLGDSRTYEVFHVEAARDSEYIPAQHEFVERYDVASVVGFGGLLRSGELFAILFSRATIPAASAGRFRSIALDVRSALYALDEKRTWKNEGRR